MDARRVVRLLTLLLLLMMMMVVVCSCGGGGGGIGSRGVQIDPALAVAIPPDTVMVVGGRMDLARKSALYQKIEPRLPLGRLSGVREQFGLDPSKDLQEFLFAYDGKAGVLLVRGEFRAKDLADKIAQAAGAADRSEYKGKVMFGRGGPSSGGGGGALAILGDGVAAGGPVKLLEAAIDAMGGGGKRGLAAPLAKSLAGMPAGAHFYAAGFGGATFNLQQGTNAGNIDKALASLESVAGFADLSNGLKVSLTGQCADAESAKRFHTQIRGLIGMGRLSTPDNQPELLKLFDAIDTKLADKTIQVGYELGTDQAEKALELLLGIARQRGN